MKIATKKLRDLYMKLKLVIQLRAVSGEIYVIILLRLILVCKQLLFKSLENGDEAFIASEISSDQLPASFRFYDPILNIIQEGISDASKDCFELQGSLFSERKQDPTYLIKKHLIDNEIENRKLRSQHQFIVERNKSEINPFISPHAMELQMSRYVTVVKEKQEIDLAKGLEIQDE